MPKKRYGILLGITLFNWIVIGWVIRFVDPVMIKDMLIPGIYLPMGLLLLSGFFWLLAILLMSTKRAIIWTLLIMTFVYLRLFMLGNLLNAIILLGLGITIEMYLKVK